MKTGRYVGVMSGTSLDGIDVVLAMIDKDHVVQLASYSHPIPFEVKQNVLAICQGQMTTLSEIGRLDAHLGELFADAVIQLLQQHKVSAKEVMAIGCHGQTVWHEPDGVYPFSLQLGDNNRIAAKTGITTVGDFRRRDMAYGGQGAPLVPAFHHALLGSDDERRIILNIGGIANLSLLIPGQSVKGYDTGPGNMLLDAWIWRQQSLPFDQDAAWAAQGKIIYPLLQHLLSDPYFIRRAPKSTGREYFNLSWLECQLSHFPDVDAVDVQATLVELTAISIVDQILLCGGAERVFVCGGGARNPLLMSRLSTLLPGIEVTTTEHAGVSGDDMEALAFAWLAYRTLSGLPGNLPEVTGARCETILGAIYPVVGTSD